MRPVSAVFAVLVPVAFFAVTCTSSVWATSADVATYVVFVAPEIAAQPPPVPTQRCHWYEKLGAGVPPHEPGLTVSVAPSCCSAGDGRRRGVLRRCPGRLHDSGRTRDRDTGAAAVRRRHLHAQAMADVGGLHGVVVARRAGDIGAAPALRVATLPLVRDSSSGSPSTIRATRSGATRRGRSRRWTEAKCSTALPSPGPAMRPRRSMPTRPPRTPGRSIVSCASCLSPFS